MKELYGIIRLKGKKSLLKGSMILGGLSLAVFFFYIWGMLSPLSPGNGQPVKLTVTRSSSTSSIGQMLFEKGLIRSAWFFNLYTRLRGVDDQLKAGTYTFSTAQSLPEIVNELVKGSDDGRVITIPEGFTLKQIAQLLEKEGLVSREDFLAAAAEDDFNYPFVKKLPPGPNRLEGYLFPDTYRVSSSTTARSIIDLMLRRFDQKMKEMDYYRKVEAAGLTLHEAVIIASMVEREARVDRERPVIAGVIFNRLQRDMPLQIDATVQYALGSQRAKLYYRDLEINSPYNTYLIKGLPPGPIACPGESSLLAAVEPVKTSYLYYVARPDGTHAFARTLDEHNANKRKYIR
jgi:UPF0755 protein